MNEYKTDQEEFWATEFGAQYIERNASLDLYAANLNLFSKIISQMTAPCSSVLELGANIGMNVGPISQLLPESEYTAVEINQQACQQLELTGCNVIQGSILDFKSDTLFDITFTKGVLIHINPHELESVYRVLYENSKKYILVAEYYNPTPVSIHYRGYEDRLFKRDFAGEILEKYKDLTLVDYGFSYHKGKFPQDDITWFLMEKK
jgi:pseudaminic acid biosynthesis-associated methylase